jgi:chromosomal replication initiator protein
MKKLHTINNPLRQELNPFDIIKIVEIFYCINQGALVSSKRGKRRIAYARAVAMYLVRELTNYSFPDIADHFKRDHSTVIKAYYRVKQQIQGTTNLVLQDTIAYLQEQIPTLI